MPIMPPFLYSTYSMHKSQKFTYQKYYMLLIMCSLMKLPLVQVKSLGTKLVESGNVTFTVPPGFQICLFFQESSKNVSRMEIKYYIEYCTKATNRHIRNGVLAFYINYWDTHHLQATLLNLTHSNSRSV